jgi:hypothetical protein
MRFPPLVSRHVPHLRRMIVKRQHSESRAPFLTNPRVPGSTCGKSGLGFQVLRFLKLDSHLKLRRKHRALRFHRLIGLVSAGVALKDANFGAVSLDWIGRATSQMRVAAAFAAADWPNEFLVFDDEGTPFHSPRPSPKSPARMQSGKAREITTKFRYLWKTAPQRGERGARLERTCNRRKLGSGSRRLCRLDKVLREKLPEFGADVTTIVGHYLPVRTLEAFPCAC